MSMDNGTELFESNENPLNKVEKRKQNRMNKIRVIIHICIM